MSPQGATPQLFGAPAPSDPGGAFSASVSSAQQTAQTQVAATQAAVSQVLQSLQFALTVKERRTQQAREIEAANTLENLRQNRADERSRAESAAAYQREVLQQRGMNFRDARKARQDREQFALEYNQRERRLQVDSAESQARLKEMRQNAAAKRANAMADFGRSMLSTALAMRPYEPGLVPGTLQVRQDFLSAGGPIGGQNPSLGGQASMLQKAGQALGGPMGAGMQNTGQMMQGGMAALGDELQKNVKGQNEIATDSARFGGQQPQPIPIQGVLPIPGNALQTVTEKLGMPPGVGQALGIGMGAGPAVVFNPQTRVLEIMGGTTPQAQKALDDLNLRAKSNPDVYALLLGSAANPLLPQNEILERGRRMLAGSPEALTTGPQGGGGYTGAGLGSGPGVSSPSQDFLSVKPPQGGAPAPQGQGRAPQGAVPAQSPSQASGAQGGQRNLQSLITGQAAGADRQATGPQADMDRSAAAIETRYRESANKYLSRFGVSGSAASGGPTPPPDPWAVEEKYGNVQGNPVNSLRRVLGMNPAGYYFYEDVPESEVRAREAELQRQRAPKPATPAPASASQAAKPASSSPQAPRGGQYRGPQDTTPMPPGPARKDGAAFAATRSKVLAGVGRSQLPTSEKSRLRNDPKALLEWAATNRDANASSLIADALAGGLITEAEAASFVERLNSARAAARPQRVRDR